MSDAVTRRHRVPGLQPGTLAAVFAGGFLGGLARYLVGRAIVPGPNAFPWDVFAVNTTGAFALALLLVLVIDVLPPTRYVRPALATGFMGAYTTFSSVAEASDHLLAHGRPGLAAVYVVASIAGGLACAVAGVVAGRLIGMSRHRTRTSRRAPR